jgi:hypothetical protein
LGGLLLTLGVDHLGAPEAFGLGLLGNGPDHVLGEVGMFDLDIRHFDTPGISLLVEDRLDIGIEAIPLGEHLVELMLTEYRAQRRLR